MLGPCKLGAPVTTTPKPTSSPESTTREIRESCHSQTPLLHTHRPTSVSSSHLTPPSLPTGSVRATRQLVAVTPSACDMAAHTARQTPGSLLLQQVWQQPHCPLRNLRSLFSSIITLTLAILVIARPEFKFNIENKELSTAKAPNVELHTLLWCTKTCS